MRIINEIGNRLRWAMETLTNSKMISCRSKDNQDWKSTCDCAMLGGLHRALAGRSWYLSGVDGWEKQVTLSVRQLVTKTEGIRTEAIGESRMRRQQRDAHKQCTPWLSMELDKVLDTCKTNDIVGPVMEQHFSKLSRMTGTERRK
jgi:hypothetical protein